MAAAASVKLVPILDVVSSLHDALSAVYAYCEKFEKPDLDDSKILCHKKIQNVKTPTEIKQLFLIRDKIQAFERLIENEERHRYHLMDEILGAERDNYYKYLSLLKKDDPFLTNLRVAFETKKEEYDKIIEPRDEPLKMAIQSKKEPKKEPKIPIENKVYADKIQNTLVTSESPTEDDPSISNPLTESAPSVDDLLLFISNEPAVPAPIIPEMPVVPLPVTAPPTPIDVPAPTTVKKKAIPNHVKTLVWNKYVGVDKLEEKCFSCRAEKIDARHFHCGHVLAEAKGGELNLTNLRPVCAACNLSMGTRSMNEFTKEFFGWEI